MRSTSVTQCSDDSRLDRDRGYCGHASPNTGNNEKLRDSVVPDPGRERGSGAETAEFAALFQALASANHLLLSYIDEIAVSIRAPGVQPFINEIANEAESIRDRMSLMATLVAELVSRPGPQPTNDPSASVHS